MEKLRQGEAQDCGKILVFEASEYARRHAARVIAEISGIHQQVAAGEISQMDAIRMSMPYFDGFNRLAQTQQTAAPRRK